MSSKKPLARESSRRAAAIVDAQRAQARRRSVLIQAGVAVAVVLAVLLVTVAVLASRDDGAPAARPTGVDASGAFTVGNPDAPVTIEVVEDLQCPACKSFEAATSELLGQYTQGDDVNVAYRPIAFLDRASTTEYSSRALNAAACVMSEGEQVWADYHQSLYENQPAEGTAGLTDGALIDLAVAAGADEQKAESCVADGRYRDWAAATTRRASDDGIDSTPTVSVNGEVLDSPSPETLRAAVESAS